MHNRSHLFGGIKEEGLHLQKYGHLTFIRLQGLRQREININNLLQYILYHFLNLMCNISFEILILIQISDGIIFLTKELILLQQYHTRILQVKNKKIHDNKI